MSTTEKSSDEPVVETPRPPMMRRGPGPGHGPGAGAPVEKAAHFGTSAKRLIAALRPEALKLFWVVVLAVASVTFTVLGPKLLGEGTNLIAYSANQKKSLSQIFLPDLKEDEKNATGYRGHDEFAVVENSLARRFPIFPEEPGDTKPTGKMRQLQYKLHPGEAGWLLKVENSSEF